MKNISPLLLALAAAFVLAASPAPAQLFGKKTDAKAEAAKDTDKETATESKDKGPYRSPRVRQLDTNKDGKITKEEFLKDNVTQFNNMDADKDGTLSPDEIDFPPGTPTDVKDRMRKQMQDQEAQQEKIRIEGQKRAEENLKKEQEVQKAAQEKAAKEAAEQVKKAPKAPAAAVAPPAAPVLAVPTVKTDTKSDKGNTEKTP